jgi:hypothetical protein
VLVTQLSLSYMESLYSRFQRENREGRDREEGLSAPIEARSFLNGIELAQAYPDTNAARAASQSW